MCGGYLVAEIGKTPIWYRAITACFMQRHWCDTWRWNEVKGRLSETAARHAPVNAPWPFQFIVTTSAQFCLPFFFSFRKVRSILRRYCAFEPFRTPPFYVLFPQSRFKWNLLLLLFILVGIILNYSSCRFLSILFLILLMNFSPGYELSQSPQNFQALERVWAFPDTPCLRTFSPETF